MTLLTISTWIPVTILSFHFKAIFPFYFQMKSETFQDISFNKSLFKQNVQRKRKIRSLLLQWKIKSYWGVKSNILHTEIVTGKYVVIWNKGTNIISRKINIYLENTMSITTAKSLLEHYLYDPPAKLRQLIWKVSHFWKYYKSSLNLKQVYFFIHEVICRVSYHNNLCLLHRKNLPLYKKRIQIMIHNDHRKSIKKYCRKN